MRHPFAVLLVAAAVAPFALPALANDRTTGVVAAFDGTRNTLVMGDRVVWELGSTVVVPEGLRNGDRVTISYVTAGEDGLVRVNAVTRY